MTVRWDDATDEILDGDHVLVLAYATPARGVVLLPVTNFALRDRAAGTVSAVNSSIGVPTKLDRMRRNPQVALAYHTREHGRSDRAEYVLVQGRASLSEPIPDYPAKIETWERYERWSTNGSLWRRWQRIYALRVEVEVTVERVVVWPDLACSGAPEVQGAPLPAESPPPQKPPRKGTGPRLDPGRAAQRSARLPNVLLGWLGADGFPVVAPARIRGAEEAGLVLDVPDGIVPPGGRRAGLTAHWFAPGVTGQDQRKYTGWLEVAPDARHAIYAPHTQSNYRFPNSRTLYRFVSGAGTRWGLRQARREGLLDPQRDELAG